MFAPLVASLILSATPGQRVLVDRIVAVVNDEIVTLSELEASSRPFMQEGDSEERKQALYKDILDQLIAERLLGQQIKDAGISVTEDEVDRAIKDILRQNKIAEEDLREAVESRGMSMGQYREDLKTQLIRLKVVDLKVRSRVVIPEADLKAEYDRKVRDSKKEELVHIRHIYFRWGESPDPGEKVRVLGTAEAARQRVLAGESFAQVAEEVSQGPTAAQGGDLGEMGAKSLLPELARGIQGVKVGEISKPIETQGGVHVVVVESRRFKEPVSFAELRDQIYQDLYTKEVERQMKIWLDELRAQSAIVVRL